MHFVNLFRVLKGLGHEIEFKYFEKWIVLGQNKNLCHILCIQYLSTSAHVGVVLFNVKHIREPLTNYQLLPRCLTALRNGFRNFCFILECILRNCQRLPDKAYQINVGNKDSAKENAQTFECHAKRPHMSQKN
jgi:hypothetical protein